MGLFIFLLVIFICWKLYETIYYKSESFLSIKNQIQSYVNNCNDLNRHIDDLKNSHIGVSQLDYGNAMYQDTSQWNYKRPELRKQKYAPNIYNCSRTVCDNARKQPFKYICKYFNIKATEETLTSVENVLNNFEAVEQGKTLIKAEKEKILNTIKNQIPILIKTFSKKRLDMELGFEHIDFSTTYFPRYIFKYISSGGNASMQCDIVMDIENLNRFINYLSETIKFKKSAAGQRALMTSSLRQKIMRRDNYTCKICGVSTYVEPNLLLEIDHIIPVSKGGLTTEDNLRTLCWKCNRKKGSKLEFNHDTINTSHNKNSENIINTSTESECEQQAQKELAIETQKIKEDILNIAYYKDKKLYSAGQYLVGRDIPLGGYVLTSKDEKIAYIKLYPNYEKYKKDDDTIICHDFTGDYHISLMEENTYLVVENADIQKI